MPKMTKLVEWLLGTGLFLGIWSAVWSRTITHPLFERNWILVTFFPIIALVTFGLYALAVVLWRVYTFNDCEEAAKEIVEQIQLAKKDLAAKGFMFETEPSKESDKTK